MKKTLALVLSFVMLFTMGMAASAFTYVDEDTDLTGFVNVKIVDPDTVSLQNGEYYYPLEDFVKEYYTIFGTIIFSGDSGNNDNNQLTPYAYLSEEKKAQIRDYVLDGIDNGMIAVMINPSNQELYLSPFGDAVILVPDEEEDIYAAIYDTFFSGIKTYTATAQPDDNGDNQNEMLCHWCGKTHGDGFFQKIIAWFHGIFAAVFGSKY